jgi:hypothetical protein
MKQRFCVLWLTELMHKLTHDNGQFAANFFSSALDRVRLAR